MGEHSLAVGEKAEAKFLDECSIHTSNWSEYSQADKDAIVEDGFQELPGVGGCIYIDWPHIVRLP